MVKDILVALLSYIAGGLTIYIRFYNNIKKSKVSIKGDNNTVAGGDIHSERYK